jgi:putative membrane protein
MASLVDKYFSEADFDTIEAAVKRAELQSSGELVIELSSHSRHWRTERLIHALVISVLCMLAALWLTRETTWGVYYSTTPALLWGGIGFLAAYFGWGSWLNRKERRRKLVWNRALGLFHQITPTRDSTGVLIFMSLEENQVAIVADKGIASKVSPDYWNAPHALIAKGMAEGKHAEGIVEAINLLAGELAKHFPHQGDDINELPDRPKVID